MSQESLTSVIIPSHNYGRFLGEAIQSVRSQTWPHWECIIVDDGSIDNTSQIAKIHSHADPRVRYIHQERQGVSAARNAAILASEGRYLQFLDADDRIEASKLASQVAFLDANPSVDLVYGDVRYFEDGVREPNVAVSRRMPFPEVSGGGLRLLENLVRRNIMVMNAPLVRRSAVDDAGCFDPQMHGHEDWDLWIRLAMKNKVFHFQRARDSSALVRVHASSAVQNIAPMLLSHLEVRRRMGLALPTQRLRRLNRYCMAIQLARFAKVEYSSRRLHGAWRYGSSAIVQSRGDPRILAYLCMPEVFATWLVVSAHRLMRRDRPDASLP